MVCVCNFMCVATLCLSVSNITRKRVTAVVIEQMRNGSGHTPGGSTLQ